jgi:RNA-directed DNA polymerase
LKTRNEDKKQVNLYGISTLSELAQALKIPEENLIEETQKGYRSYFVQGKTKKRLIEEPNMILKDILKDLKKLLVKMFDCPEYNKCWLGGNNYINAQAHVGQHAYVTTDISSFFTNSKACYVRRFFKNKLNISGEALEILVQMCTFRGHIPTGAPTSSILAFLAHKDLFDEIAEYMSKKDIIFTLYVDDITLSAKHGISGEEIKFIKSVLKKHKLEIKLEKTKFYSFKKAMITGFYLNQGGKVSVPDSVGYKVVSLLREKPLEDMNKKELRRLIGLINYCQTADKRSFSATKRNAIQALKRLDKKEKGGNNEKGNKKQQ